MASCTGTRIDWKDFFNEVKRERIKMNQEIEKMVCRYRTNEGNKSDIIRKYEDVIKKKRNITKKKGGQKL